MMFKKSVLLVSCFLLFVTLFAAGCDLLGGGGSGKKNPTDPGNGEDLEPGWYSLGTGADYDVNALAFDASGNLYIGGEFDTAGGITVNNIAKWNGTAWSALGTGVTGDTGVNALVFDSAGNLYAAGVFTTAGGNAASNIARWNGAAWSALGAGIVNDV